MADKIDQLKIGSTSYDIDLPPDATPSIAELTVDNGNMSQIYVNSHNGLSSLTLSTDGISPDNGYNQLDIWVTSGLKFEQSKQDSGGSHVYTWTFPEKGGTIALADDIKNATLTIQKNGTTVTTFTANASTDVTANISVPTKTSDLTNDSGFVVESALGPQTIVLEDNGSTTAGTWLAKTDKISALAEGQLFLYKVAVAGASTTKLNITGSAGTALGAKTIYRYGTTKLTTQYAVGSYILLYYNGSAFTAVNDYDANSYAYVRQYQAGPAGAGTGTKYPILTRYNLTDKASSYDTAYSRFHTDVTIDTNDGTLNAPAMTVNNVSVATMNDIKPAMVSTTWSALKALRDGGTLVPGQLYRITDFVTTTSRTNTLSANHPFDIIVMADSANKLNETAGAILHSGDTYFANNKLEAWKLWYCLDNDTNRFVWADSTNGKGVIYRMIDEFDNDIPYDFKNILFTVSGRYTNAYTFSYTENSTIKDASLLGLSKSCYGNIMKAYILNAQQDLNFNVFYSTNDTCSCFSNTFGNNCLRNTFGHECYKNTFGNACMYNSFRRSCHSNTFGNDCSYCTIENNCRFNVCGSDSASVVLGTGCVDNIFGNTCGYTSLPAYCKYINVDDGCRYLSISSTDTSASTSNYLQNVHIHAGVLGTSSDNRKTITIPDRNLPYETNVYMNANGNIKMVINAETGWTYSDAHHTLATDAQIVTDRFLTISDDHEEGYATRPTNSTGIDDPDVYLYSTGITVVDGDGEMDDITLSYPSQGGILGLQIDIDDLTQMNN